MFTMACEIAYKNTVCSVYGSFTGTSEIYYYIMINSEKSLAIHFIHVNFLKHNEIDLHLSIALKHVFCRISVLIYNL